MGLKELMTDYMKMHESPILHDQSTCSQAALVLLLFAHLGIGTWLHIIHDGSSDLD